MPASISPAPDTYNEAATNASLAANVPLELAGVRLDRALAILFPDYSRSRLQRWVRDGSVTVDDSPSRPQQRLNGGERLTVRVLEQLEGDWLAQEMPLRVVFADDDVLVIDKPAGLVVHPGAGNPHTTLVNALLHHHPRLSSVPRAGIVHRLDKHTSGLLMVACNLTAHKRLVDALKAREVTREYVALVHGQVAAGGTVDEPLGRHPRLRTRVAVTAGGRRAVTHYSVRERFAGHTLLELRLETGRTHQIRVHMLHIGHPIVGDPVYRTGAHAASAPGGIERQALHAWRLVFDHPGNGRSVSCESPVPDDFQRAIVELRRGTAPLSAGG